MLSAKEHHKSVRHAHMDIFSYPTSVGKFESSRSLSLLWIYCSRSHRASFGAPNSLDRHLASLTSGVSTSTDQRATDEKHCLTLSLEKVGKRESERVES